MSVITSPARLKPLDTDNLLRKAVRGSLWCFVREFWSSVPGAAPLVPNWHMEVLCQELEYLAHRVIKGLPVEHDLVYNLPPGTSKSSVASILFPAWLWTLMPECRFLCVSHTDTLVLDLSVKCRNLITGELYQRLFPHVQLTGDQDTKSSFRNVQGGERMTATVGGKSPTGRHAHVHICDDLVDPKSAASQADMLSARTFLMDVLPSRKVDKAVTPCALIMQRLAPGDPTDVMMESSRREDATPVKRVCLPAEESDLVEPPELRARYVDGLLDPHRLGRAVLKRERARMTLHAYSAQYGQNPTPPEGGMFKAVSFGMSQRVRTAPYDCRRVYAFDRAATHDGGCYTAGVLLGRDRENRCYIEHVMHGRWEPDERNDRIVDEALRCRSQYGPRHEPVILIEMERGSTGLESFKALCRRLAGFKVREASTTGSKDVRAEGWADYIASLNVFVVDNGESKALGRAKWDVAGFIEEHVRFRPQPGKRLGGFCDRVDAACLIGGTMILTDRGPVPIERIFVGDLVLTRRGMREVTWAGQSGVASRLVEVLFSDGTVLIGTPDHLVWTLDGMYTRLSDLEGYHRVLGRPQRCWTGVSINARSRRGLKSSGLTAGLTTVIANRRIFGASHRGGSHSMLPYGSTITAPSPLAMRYITRTATQVITVSRILSALPRRNTHRDIQVEESSLDSVSICRGPEPKRMSGMLRQKAGKYTLGSGGTRGSAGQPRTLFVPTVGRSLLPYEVGLLELRCSAPASVLQLNSVLEGGTETIRRSVQLVREFLAGRSGASSALRSALCGGAGTVPVYDLMVAGEPEFFANGILVHNSHAYNFLFDRVRAPGSLPLERVDFRPPQGKGPPVRFLVVEPEELSQLVLTEPVILVHCTDPVPKGVPDEYTLPGHALERVVCSVILPFADLTSEEMQHVWDVPIPGYDKLPVQVIADRSTARKLWSVLLRRHEIPPRYVIFSGEGSSDGRPLSVAMACADALGYKREEVFVTLSDQDDSMGRGHPPNRHVYDVFRTNRAGL